MFVEEHFCKTCRELTKMNNTDNTSDATGPFSFSTSFVYPVATCHILIVAVAIFGNLLVCYTILAHKNLRKIPTNLFISSLAFSDLLTVTLALPFDIEGLFIGGVWKHGEIMCKAWITVYLITVPTSILTLLAVSVDRYKSLSDPLNRFPPLRIHDSKKGFDYQLRNLAIQFAVCFTSNHGLANTQRVRLQWRLLLSFHADLFHAKFFPEFYFTTSNGVRHSYQDLSYGVYATEVLPRK